MATTSLQFTDAIGTYHPPATMPARIISLVPSITELLFALDLGDQIVGRTSYCIHPVTQVTTVPSVGGTKKVKHELIRALQPTHIIVNIDETPKPLAQKLATYIPHVIVTHPCRPEDNLDLYWLMGGIFGRQDAAETLCTEFNNALGELQEVACGRPQQRIVYLIWKKPWMGVSRGTYIANMLALVNWQTVPADTSSPYPRLDISPEWLTQVDRVLFSTEPYPFKAEDLMRFSNLYGFPFERTSLIDGEMISWYGNRAIQGLAYLQRYTAI